MTDATRETFGNIPPSSILLFYVLACASLAVLIYGLYRRFGLWRRGATVEVMQLFKGGLRRVMQKVGPGLRRLLIEGLGQKRVRGRGLPSWAHGLMFTGFLALLAGTTLLEIDHLGSKLSAHFHFHHGLYYTIYELTLDLLGLAFIIGLCLFLCWRSKRPASVGHAISDWVVLLLLIGIGITGYLVEGLRVHWDDPQGIARWCSPVGALLAKPIAGWSEGLTRDLHLGFWWVHAILVFGFFSIIPYTRLMHLITGPLNLFLARSDLGALRPVSLEQVEETGRVGVGEIGHFDQQQLLSLDACMECGRCEDACPAFATGKPLSPKVVIQDLREAMSTTGNGGGGSPSLHGATIRAETLWSCTSCSACVTACPVRVDPLTMILEMRRNLAAEGSLAGSSANSLRQMQTRSNPWGFAAADRLAWAQGLEVPTCRENPGFEVLYWVGCAGSFDRRAQKVSRAVVKLLRHAKVNFAVLGAEEGCTGESARRLGDEFLFQELAEKNHAALQRYSVRKILTQCPHCLNSLRQDYPQFGERYEVVHHTQFFQNLIAQGRLHLPEGTAETGSVTYHDPCYLARVNGIHEEPRELLNLALDKATGASGGIREMSRCREKTFCCGAGGGRMWMEEQADQRVSVQRGREAVETGAQTVAVGCPFCLTMMSDGVATHSKEAKVRDVAEILADRLPEE